MASAEQPTRIPPETPLPACPERPIGLSLPHPISVRLDLLLELVEQAGERTSRKELIASLIYAAADDAEELIRWLHLYRTGRADSVYPSSNAPAQVLEPQPGRPGPRPRQWRQHPPAT